MEELVKSISIASASKVSGGMIGGGYDQFGIPLLSAGSCGVHASDMDRRVTGLAGQIGLGNVFDMLFGDSWHNASADWFYQGCMAAGIYGTNQNLDTYDPNVMAAIRAGFPDPRAAASAQPGGVLSGPGTPP
jgi:hypothetical protein